MTSKRGFLIGGAVASAALAAGRSFAQPIAAAGRPVRPPTNTDEAKVRSFSLPDPLVLDDGSKVSDVLAWTRRRRPEILRLFEQTVYGVTERRRLTPHYEVVDEGVVALGGMARRSQVRIRFADGPQTPVIRVLVYTPAAASGPTPTVLHIGFSPAVLLVDEPGIDVGMAWDGRSKARTPDRKAERIADFDIRYFVQRGYGVAYVYYGDIEPDFEGGRTLGVRALFGPQTETRKPDEWGSIGAWSWGLSRVLDYLQTHEAVDGARVALTGVSRLAKTVLWAGAQDQRFAVVMPCLSGAGGAKIIRRNYGETIADLTAPDRFAYWFAPRYAGYAFDVDRLPVDGHMLLGLIAPRPVLQITGSADTWSDPRGEYLASRAAAPVYRLFGRRAIGFTDFPKPDSSSLYDMGYFLHDGPHTVLPADFATMAEFMDLHLRRG